ncbi:MAG: hypothetical protein AVDCRST_MAG57-67, partial [uncultured Blastococcus sp.]
WGRLGAWTRPCLPAGRRPCSRRVHPTGSRPPSLGCSTWCPRTTGRTRCCVGTRCSSPASPATTWPRDWRRPGRAGARSGSTSPTSSPSRRWRRRWSPTSGRAPGWRSPPAASMWSRGRCAANGGYRGC